jgi:hypothetical protein
MSRFIDESVGLVDINTFQYNVVVYGAKGDGVTNDSAAFQAAIDAMPSTGTSVLYIPNEGNTNYYIGSRIDISGKSIIIQGNGATLTTLLLTNTIFYKTDHDNAPLIKDLTFTGNGTAIEYNMVYTGSEYFDGYFMNCNFRMYGVSRSKTGTVSASIYGSTVTGTGTAFLSEFSVGDYIQIGIDYMKIYSITNDNLLTVDGYFEADHTSETIYKVTPGYGIKLFGARAIKCAYCNFDDFITPIKSYTQTAVYIQLSIEPHFEGCTFQHNLESIFFDGYGLFDPAIGNIAYDAGLRIHNCYIQGNVYGVRCWYIDLFEISNSLIDLNRQKCLEIYGTDQGQLTNNYLGNDFGPVVVMGSGYKSPSELVSNILFSLNKIHAHDDGNCGTYGCIEITNGKYIRIDAGNEIQFWRSYGVKYTSTIQSSISGNTFSPASGLGLYSVYCASGDSITNYIAGNTMVKRISVVNAIRRNNIYIDGNTPYIDRITLDNLSGIPEVQSFESKSNYAINRGVKTGYYVPNSTASSRLGGEIAFANESSNGAYCIISTERAGTITEALRIKSDGSTGIGTSSPNSTLDVNGTARFGDSATNYTLFEADGTMQMFGTATVFEDLNYDPSSSGGPAVTVPDYVTINNTIHREFTSANNQLCGSGNELPHSYKLSSTIYPHIHIFLKNGESAGATGVTFTFYWELRQSTGTTSGSVALSATSAELGTTAGANKFTIYDNTGFAGAAEIGAQLSVTIARTAGNAGDVVVSTYGVHYEINSIGSHTLLTK